MRTVLSYLFLVMLSVSFAKNSAGVALRYALIIGNNVGVNEEGEEPYPPLKFAESEATQLRNTLVDFSNFDSSGQRTQLLKGATKAEVRSAIQTLVNRKKKDNEIFGRTKTLFLFYFTGHGLKGELLLEDGPLSADEIGEMFRTVDADFSVGVFDACYSGSLQNAALNAKGFVPTPGLNLFRELPEEVLSAEGSIWYVSSGPGQASYEDEALGGVFTHFFIKALAKAPLEGPGITLERIWSYARQHTVEFTTARNRTQVPEQFIARLKTNAPIYFSFPVKRSATLVLSGSVEGPFALSYNTGHLTEIIQKPRGQEKKVALFPGNARLLLLRGGKAHVIKNLDLKEGMSLTLSQLSEEFPKTSLGEHTVELWEKGVGTEHLLTASVTNPGTTILGGLAYGYLYSEKGVLSPRHLADMSLRFDHAHVVLALRAGYGFDRQTLDAWDYTAHALVWGGSVGYGFDLDRFRLTLFAVISAASIWQIYGNRERRQRLSTQPALRVSLLFPTDTRVAAAISAWAGPAYSPAEADIDDMYWHLSVGVGASVFYRMR